MAYKQSPGRMNMPKTGRGIDSAALMTGETSPLLKFPIKKGTKLNEGEKVIVRYNGQEQVFDNKADAEKDFTAKSDAWSSSPGSNYGTDFSTRPTKTGVTDLGGGNFTEQRKRDVDAGGVSDRYAQVRSRSAKNPKGTDQRSAYLKQDKKPLSSIFSISTDEKSGITSRAYKDSEEPKNK
jgi:hypothetical protein